ncbi:cobalt-precorrin-6B (C15)-methyltransferase [Methanohalophilus levihalophilus]|uniref:precorrin-6Y C5,15-methyltransferase (decarboxylating) subunit CbiT n=1 Tax=Methanohalophilus levihalophilus TaxID=1431282 RepID=UPI001AE71973|nr:precorrin-6Y C5,15-methyltransferase (decarboxylating) subunit CbiT [Methanohalophilus levihalophilus]MBP2031097.1 cobalt-precorrin-6B (C15)-methyltransferase [Methanohalophilus levihalophilus]
MPELLHISGGPTKPEIIAVSLSKLNLRDGCNFYDVGCGTGAVSIEASKIARNLRVTAIDAREKAIEVAKQNFENFKIEGAKLIHGESSAALKGIPEDETIDYAFVGGTKNIDSILEALVEKKAKAFVINAVRIETVVHAMEKMKELGVFEELVNVSISRSYPITGETMLKPENPVFILVGRNHIENGDEKC